MAATVRGLALYDTVCIAREDGCACRSAGYRQVGMVEKAGLRSKQGRGRRGRFCLGRTLEAGTERESRHLGKSLRAGGKAWQGGRRPCLYCSLLVNLQYNLIPARRLLGKLGSGR